jgi:hypothetical protein
MPDLGNGAALNDRRQMSTPHYVQDFSNHLENRERSLVTEVEGLTMERSSSSFTTRT